MTNGHLDIATRASTLFDELVIAVYRSPDKRVLFSWEDRIAMARESTAHLVNTRVEGFSGLMVNYAMHVGANVIVRGLRAGSDFEGEFQMALANRMLAPRLETICLIGSQNLMFISSSRIKEIALLGGDVSGLVPPPVAERLALLPSANMGASGTS
ncbi:MAG: pantetheine-phosphate adenylyltransferase [Chloroflexi bacterium]|jgi:pantetheine-phosphate adenylyltransferase|nr:pantetheine-phosphate adenylyltransferase [Chloroflexota bacterium]MDB5075151.1 pantetheine-phosphate adenylyltransferase [Chloroflexota bacterium]